MTNFTVQQLNDLTYGELEMFLTGFNTVFVIRCGNSFEAFTSTCVSVDSDEEFIAEVHVSDYFATRAEWRAAFIKHSPNDNPDNYAVALPYDDEPEMTQEEWEEENRQERAAEAGMGAMSMGYSAEAAQEAYYNYR